MFKHYFISRFFWFTALCPSCLSSNLNAVFICLAVFLWCCWAGTQTGVIHHPLPVTNITASSFGHNLDVEVLQLPEFLLSASGCAVEVTEAEHLWGLSWRNTWQQPSEEVAGVLTAQLPPRGRLKPFPSFPPPTAAPQNICSLKTYGLQQNFNSVNNEST